MHLNGAIKFLYKKGKLSEENTSQAKVDINHFILHSFHRIASVQTKGNSVRVAVSG